MVGVAARRMFASLGTIPFADTYLSPAAGRRHFTHPFADVHHEIGAILDDPAQDRVAIGSFRGLGKSAVASLAFPLSRSILDPELRYARFAAATEDLAKERMEDLQIEVRANRAIRRDFGDLWHPRIWEKTYFRILKPAQEHLEVDARESVAWKIATHRSELRGTKAGADRLQLVIVDDPQGSKRLTAAERGRFEDWFLADLEPAVAEDGGRIILITNLARSSTLIAKILDGWPQSDGRGNLIGDVDEGRAKAWGEWTRRRYACMVPDPDGEPDPDDPSKRWRSAFPSRLPIKRLFAKRERLRLKGKLGIWWAEWMSDPKDAALQVFSREALDEELSYALRPPRDIVEARLAWPAIRPVGVMDPAFSKNPDTAHKCALAVTADLGLGYFPLLDYFVGVGLGLADRRNLVWRFNARWHFVRFGFEYIGAQADLYDSFLEDQRRKIAAGWLNASFEVVKVKPPHDKSKVARIQDLAWAQAQGIWRLAASHGDVRLREADFRDAPGADDDLLDVCEMAWRQAEALPRAVVPSGFARDVRRLEEHDDELFGTEELFG